MAKVRDRLDGQYPIGLGVLLEGVAASGASRSIVNRFSPLLPETTRKS